MTIEERAKLAACQIYEEIGLSKHSVERVSEIIAERITEQKAIDDEATLKGFTTDELRAERKKRNLEEKAKKASVLRCRMCRHWGAIDYWGNPLNSDFRDKRSCKFFKTKNGKNYRCHNASQLACEHFERKEE